LRLSFMGQNIRIFKNTNKGFLSVEAAIFFPIFFIGVLTLAYLIRFMSIQESVFHSFTDEARVLSSEARFNVTAPLFESKLKTRIYDENGKDIQELDLENFQYLYYLSAPGMISIDLNYYIDIKLPIPFIDKLPVSESLLFRGFVGLERPFAPISIEEMEREEPSHLVWIFPRAGGRYHKETCTYISSEPRQLTMSKIIRQRYKPCSICKPFQLSDGGLVYCYIKWGEAYHKGSCPAIDKYVVSIEKEEAIQKGYTPCSKCGGG
jgi:hypothetical protein